jgi:hypothetical protein
MATQKRDNAYYLQRLKTVRHDLYLEVQAGRMSVAAARKIANLGGNRTRLHELRNAWRHATTKQRQDFLTWAGLAPLVVRATTVAPTTAWAADMTMHDWAKRRLEEILSRRSMSYGNLADELGIKRLNASISMAVTRGTKVKSSSSRDAVDRWLLANAGV